MNDIVISVWFFSSFLFQVRCSFSLCNMQYQNDSEESHPFPTNNQTRKSNTNINKGMNNARDVPLCPMLVFMSLFRGHVDNRCQPFTIPREMWERKKWSSLVFSDLFFYTSQLFLCNMPGQHLRLSTCPVRNWTS